jgi:hypothetical protein
MTDAGANTAALVSSSEQGFGFFEHPAVKERDPQQALQFHHSVTGCFSPDVQSITLSHPELVEGVVLAQLYGLLAAPHLHHPHSTAVPFAGGHAQSATEKDLVTICGEILEVVLRVLLS